MVKKKKASQYDDYITNRILAIFSYAFVLILGLVATYRGYTSIETIQPTVTAVYYASAVLAVIAAAGLVWEYLSVKRKADTRYKLICGRNLAGAAAIAALCEFIAAYFFVDGIKALYVVIPALTVLLMIYMIYSADFFAISVVTSIGGFLMWYMSRSHINKFITAMPASEFLRSSVLYATILVILIQLAALILILSARGKDGEIKIGNRTKQFFHPNANYRLMILSVVLTILCTVAGFLFGAAIAYYLIFIMFGYLFVMAFYYTVKLM